MNKKNRNLSWKSNLLSDNLKIIDAIKCIDRSGLKIVLVLNRKKKFIGTITDGDIRRGMLRGLKINSPIKSIINKKPYYLSDSKNDEAIYKLMIRHKIYQIPIVSKNKKVVGLKLLNNFNIQKDQKNTIIIMAGGKGKRMLPYTKNKPKPLLKIKDKPILEHILSKAKKEGFKNFIFTINYLGQKIKKYFNDGKKWNVKISYVKEKLPLGTVGGIKLIKPLPKEPIIVCNGDVISDIKFEDLLNFHIKNKAFATMAIKSYEIENPYGVVNLRGEKILNLDEKPVIKSNINVGVYIFNPEAINYIRKNESLDMNNFFDRLVKLNKRVLAYPVYESWADIGRPSDLKKIKKKRVKY